MSALTGNNLIIVAEETFRRFFTCNFTWQLPVKARTNTGSTENYIYWE
jgi:hypothetical protein